VVTTDSTNTYHILIAILRMVFNFIKNNSRWSSEILVIRKIGLKDKVCTIHRAGNDSFMIAS